MKLAMGIDLGTTKAAVALLDIEKRSLVAAASKATCADLPCEAGKHEQDVSKIFKTVDELVASLDPALKAGVEAIGVTGQMHGVVLSAPGERSPLITWKDARASAAGELSRIQKTPGCEKLKDGFGFASLACLAGEGALERWSSASTVHDLLVAEICELSKPVVDPGDAASWGLFDVFNGRWNAEALRALKIPEKLAPALVESGAQAGRLSSAVAAKWGVKAGAPVAAAIGDNQASILATALAPDEEIYLTLGTGAQLSVVLKREAAERLPSSSSMELRPFMNGRLLAVAAPLCGGQAFAWLVNSLSGFLKELGVEPLSEASLYAKLDELAMKTKNSSLRVKPNFLGERHEPALRGEIENIDFGNFKLGELASALAEGVISNMRTMMPEAVFAGKRKIVASGNAMRKLSIMRLKAEELFGIPVKLVDSKEEAACGAAIIAGKLVAR